MLICDVYKGTKQKDLYIYVDRSEGLSKVPELLLRRFGEASVAISFKLDSDRKLAKEDPEKVIQAIKDTGYFLQMPPQEFPKRVE